jgi:hypothetical protein
LIQPGPTSPRSDAFVPELRESLCKVGESRLSCIEQMQVEVEALAWPDGSPVQMRGSEYEWTRRVGQTAGTSTRGGGFEDPRIRAGVTDVAGRRASAFRNADDSPEYDSERPPQYVPGLTLWKMQSFE